MRNYTFDCKPVTADHAVTHNSPGRKWTVAHALHKLLAVTRNRQKASPSPPKELPIAVVTDLLVTGNNIYIIFNIIKDKSGWELQS